MKHCCQPRFTPLETEHKVRDALRIVDSTYRKALKIKVAYTVFICKIYFTTTLHSTTLWVFKILDAGKTIS